MSSCEVQARSGQVITNLLAADDALLVGHHLWPVWLVERLLLDVLDEPLPVERPGGLFLAAVRVPLAGRHQVVLETVGQRGIRIRPDVDNEGHWEQVIIRKETYSDR